MFELSEILLEWYHKNKRELPWRNTTDPYKIWLSEVILQQTRVAQGLPYYLKFTQNFPTVFALAAASEDEVLFNWKGLGYYSRARNLHQTAKILAENYKGIFPTTYQELIGLKGVGEYTGAAIASFCYNEVVPVVDGNVFRVLSRIFNWDEPIDTGKGKNKFKALAAELIDKKNPAIFNQAIMEFGALLCVPKSPNCPACPMQMNCQAYHAGTISVLPVKSKKIKRTQRYFNYLLIKKVSKGISYWAIQQRDKGDIWAQLYEFPLLETSQEAHHWDELKTKLIKGQGFEFKVIKQSPYKKHVLTHQDIYYSFWELTIEEKLESEFSWKTMEQIQLLAFPKLLENYIETGLRP